MSPIQYKIKRIQRGGAPRVLDLFAGCGGLSLGFSSAGFDVRTAIEVDSTAAQTFSQNLGDPLGGPLHVAPEDIRRITPQKLAEDLDLGPIGNAFDVIVGGPPCQAYARIGRAKLRQVASHPSAYRKDPRARLHREYLRYVRECQPLAMLIENVPDILRFGRRNVAQEISEELEALGYEVRYTLLNAASYGVPQYRERAFLIAYHERLGRSPTFPSPSHEASLPRGYLYERRALLGFAQALDHQNLIQPPVTRSRRKKGAITARQALGDLPKLDRCQIASQIRGPASIQAPHKYSNAGRMSAYAHLMRNWRSFETNGNVTAQVTRNLPRDFRLFASMMEGDEYPEAHRIAVRLFKEAVRRRRRKGVALTEASAAYRTLRKQYVPPYDPTKFPNKWWKLLEGAPSRTLTAHLGRDTYSHIHYDDSQCRTISVREAARLQSFPDGFEFAGSMNSAFRQIGNAVPPLLAKALAHSMKRALRGT